MKLKVISGKQLPTRIPLTQTVLMYLILDKFHAAGWVWGAVGLFYFLGWVVAIVGLCNQESVEIRL